MAKETVFTMKLEADLRADFVAETEALHQPAVAAFRFQEDAEILAASTGLAHCGIAGQRGGSPDAAISSFAGTSERRNSSNSARR